VEQFYRLLGWDILNLIQQYYTSHDIVRIADTYEGQRWVEINAPLEIPTGRMGPNGMPETRLVFEEVLDPETNKPLVDENNKLVMAPIPTASTDIAFTKADISISSVAYDDEDAKNQTMLETFLNGPSGNFLMQANPAGYLRASEMAVKNVKTKYSDELADILSQTAQMVGGNPQMSQQLSQGQQSSNQVMNQTPGRAPMGGVM
jgi:hypothetical protein